MKIKYLFAIVFVLFLFSQRIVFAKDFRVNGKILDSNNNPIPQGVIAFIDANGKTIAAATADSVGAYEVLVTGGNYSIMADGPRDAGLKGTTLSSQAISSDKTLDFTLEAPVIEPAVKPSSIKKFLPLVIAFVVLLIIACGVVILKRKKKTSVTE